MKPIQCLSCWARTLGRTREGQKRERNTFTRNWKVKKSFTVEVKPWDVGDIGEADKRTCAFGSVGDVQLYGQDTANNSHSSVWLWCGECEAALSEVSAEAIGSGLIIRAFICWLRSLDWPPAVGEYPRVFSRMAICSFIDLFTVLQDNVFGIYYTSGTLPGIGTHL